MRLASQSSPLHHGSMKEKRTRSPDHLGHRAHTEKGRKSSQDFPAGSSEKTCSVCTVCLGRHRHDIYLCDEQQHPTVSRRDQNRGLLKKNNSLLCIDWNWEPGCTSQLHTSILPDLSAQDVICHHTERQNALLLKANHVLSPYHPDAMEQHLITAGLRDKYTHIIKGLQMGFKIDFPPITATQTPPN